MRRRYGSAGVSWKPLLTGALAYVLARLLLGLRFQPSAATLLAMGSAFLGGYRLVPEGRVVHGLLAAYGGYAGTILLSLIVGGG